jgi:hypothetical protein
MSTTTAPWTDEQVAALNVFQNQGRFHPFTCGRDHSGSSPVLTATPEGWRCPVDDCDYTQDWALKSMLDVGLEMTRVSPSCGTTQHCANHGFCTRCDPQLSSAALHLVRALHDAGVPDENSGEVYREMVVVLRQAVRGGRITSPEDNSKVGE